MLIISGNCTPPDSYPYSGNLFSCLGMGCAVFYVSTDEASSPNSSHLPWSKKLAPTPDGCSVTSSGQERMRQDCAAWLGPTARGTAWAVEWCSGMALAAMLHHASRSAHQRCNPNCRERKVRHKLQKVEIYRDDEILMEVQGLCWGGEALKMMVDQVLQEPSVASNSWLFPLHPGPTTCSSSHASLLSTQASV